MSTCKKKARPDGDASEQAGQENHTSGNSRFKFTTAGRITQAGTVSKLLSMGRDGAITGAKLVQLLELKDLRELTQLVEAERRAGIPICATTNSSGPGYYLADGPEKLQDCISSLDRPGMFGRLRRYHFGRKKNVCKIHY